MFHPFTVISSTSSHYILYASLTAAFFLEWNLRTQVAGTLYKSLPGSVMFSHLVEVLEASTELPPFQKAFPDTHIPSTPRDLQLPLYHLAQLSLYQIIKACLYLPCQISVTGRQKYSGDTMSLKQWAKCTLCLEKEAMVEAAHPLLNLEETRYSSFTDIYSVIFPFSRD